ncbi:hypothetical protein SUGI_0745730 [Cryptomeria japonica]|nr:hypothetical protein SUGI_0745730 [Cryptomeria japonica]
MAIAQLKEAREHLSQSLKRRKELAKEINDHEYVETKIEDLFPTSSSNEVDEANNAIKELLEKNGLLQKEVRMLRREQEIQSARFCEILEQRNKMQNEIEGRNNEIVQHEDLTEQLSNANEEIRILKEQNESLKNELDIQKQANERMMKTQTDLDQLNEQNLHKQKGKAGLGYNEEGESSEQEKSLTELNVTEHGKTADLTELAIPNTPAFGTYDEAKARIELEIKLPKAITSTKRKAAKETEETKEELEEEAETPKKKGKVVITKPKLKTAVFTRRTRKGQKESEVVFRKPPSTFEEKLKQLEQGSGMSNFKALKYESRSDAEKMQIEELLLNKMGKWKYTPDDISSQIPNELLVRIRPRWTSAVQTVKDIYAQTLKQLLPNLTYKEVKEALKENEHQMTLRFHTFLVLSKQIEAIVNNATIVWKRIYNLPMPSDPTVTIEGDKDDEEDEEEKEEEEAAEEEGDTVIIGDEEDTVIIGDEEDDPEQVAAEVIASLPHSPQKGVASSASASRIVSTVATSIAQSLPITSQLQTPTVTSSTEPQSMSLSTGMQSVASTEQQVTSSVTEITTSPAASIVSFATSPVLTHSLAQMITPINTPACTSILGTVGTSMSLPLVNPIPVITATPTLSTIVTTSKDKEVSTKVIQKTPLKLLLIGKAIEDDIDLDKEIVIPQIDLNTASIDEMRLISQLLEQKAKQKQLRSERDREFNIINGAKTILTDALGIKVDPSQHILLQLEEAMNRFNEDSSGEEKLIERTEKKFDNKVLEHIAQQIAIKQVELTTILAKLENSFNNITSFCANLCDVTEFTKGIRDQLKKIDDDLKVSAQQLQLDPSSSSTHHSNIRFLLDKQSELLREDARIRSTLLDIQNMILPNMDTMQKHITHSKTLIHDNSFSVAEHVIELSAKVQVALSICTILQENWDKTLARIKQVHSEFISHFNISI